MGESFREFLESFSYGSRSDLAFKFLKNFTDEEAGEFLQQMLAEVGELYDGLPPSRLIDLAYQSQIDAYKPKLGAKRTHVYDDRPFAPLPRPLNELNLGLVTSSGHFIADDPPTDGRGERTQAEVVDDIDAFLGITPELSAIPTDSAPDQLVVRHPGYDTRSSVRDPEVALPIQALARAADKRVFKSLAPTAYSFVGAASQLRLRADKDGWVDAWKAAGIEALFLVPV